MFLNVNLLLEFFDLTLLIPQCTTGGTVYENQWLFKTNKLGSLRNVFFWLSNECTYYIQSYI